MADENDAQEKDQTSGYRHPCNGIRYVIQPGDTLYAIAKRYGISLNRLIAANPQIADPNVIYPGEVICIPTSPAPPTPPTLSIGSRGVWVERLQRMLTSLGYRPGPIDGIFGPRTQQAVLAFQGDHGLVQDGIVGPKTWAALFEVAG
ncbi:MAG: SafA/ExsA family spore coat assembly protein [Firmicutes bacterium]|nr:SafA/ExsA family spore coat assembly protein [Bacillota bacterium]